MLAIPHLLSLGSGGLAFVAIFADASWWGAVPAVAAVLLGLAGLGVGAYMGDRTFVISLGFVGIGVLLGWALYVH
jgi:hypothetical protein